MLWIRRDIALNHPCAVDSLLIKAGIVKSLTEARRLIADGAIYLNGEKLVSPEKGFLPILVITEEMSIADYIALGL